MRITRDGTQLNFMRENLPDDGNKIIDLALGMDDITRVNIDAQRGRVRIRGSRLAIQDLFDKAEAHYGSL